MIGERKKMFERKSYHTDSKKKAFHERKKYLREKVIIPIAKKIIIFETKKVFERKYFLIEVNFYDPFG